MAESKVPEFEVTSGILEDIPRCAEIACDSEIGRRYCFRAQTLEKRMVESTAGTGLLLVAHPLAHNIQEEERRTPAREVAGFVWVEPKGAFGQAPYLKLIAVDRNTRSSGVGALLLAEFERHTSEIGTAWFLLVSDFNARAVAFYERHGYAVVGKLPAFAVADIDEIIMYKHH